MSHRRGCASFVAMDFGLMGDHGEHRKVLRGAIRTSFVLLSTVFIICLAIGLELFILF